MEIVNCIFVASNASISSRLQFHRVRLKPLPLLDTPCVGTGENVAFFCAAKGLFAIAGEKRTPSKIYYNSNK